MKKILKIELKKAIFSKKFVLGTGLLTIFAILSAIYSIENWGDYNPSYLKEYCISNGKYIHNPDFPTNSFFNAWIGGDMLSLAYTLFFTFLPVGAALPYAWSFYIERKNGYIRNIATRTNKMNYYYSKIITVFLSGSFAVLVPYIINIFVVSAFIPYYKPWAGYNFYNMIFFGNMWADLFFSKPIIHMILVVTLNVLYGGIFALLSFAISFFIKNIIAILFGPFLLMIICGYIENIIVRHFLKNSLIIFEFVPTRFLHSRTIYNQVTSENVICITMLLLILSLTIILLKGYKDEIY